MYQSGVDEQLIIKHTGHRSLEGVPSYKEDLQQTARSSIRHLELLKTHTNIAIVYHNYYYYAK